MFLCEPLQRFKLLNCYPAQTTRLPPPERGGLRSDTVHSGYLLPFNYIIPMRSSSRPHSAGQFDGQNQGFGASNDLFGIVFAKRFQIHQIRSHTQSK